MIYKNFSTLSEFKKQFKLDVQYLNSMSTAQLMEKLDVLEEQATNWVYNFCAIEKVAGTNYINLFWTSEHNKTYNLMVAFREFTDFYNKLVQLKNMQNMFSSFIDDLAKENWKF